MQRVQSILGFAWVGCIPPVLFIILHGLQNEGWESLRFLFWLPIERYVTAALIAAVAFTFSIYFRRAVQTLGLYAESSPMRAIGASVAGLLISAAALWSIGYGEPHMRKFYTYLVAPRAFSVLLALAVPIVYMLGRSSHAKVEAAA